MGQIAAGQFGTVVRARHRLDGMVYAIKITKKVFRPNSRDEKVALNEVFAHAAMMKHRNIIRYFNSWVEAYHYPSVKVVDGSASPGDPQLTGVPFNDAYRYMDWLLTVPLLLIEIH